MPLVGKGKPKTSVSSFAGIRVRRTTTTNIEYMTEKEFIAMLKKMGKGKFLKAHAKELGVSYQFLGKVFNGINPVGDKIPKRLGYERLTVYRKLPAKPSRKAKTTAKAKK